MKNEKRYLYFWIGVLILSIFMAFSCTKEPQPNFDPNCGVITLNQRVDSQWIVAYKWNDGTRDTIIWSFDVQSYPGDTVCKLLPVEPLNCKP